MRFIEYMDVGGATQLDARQGRLARGDPRDAGAAVTGRSGRSRRRSSAPAERFRLSDGTVFGIIASTTAPFCASCDRSRLTADGLWYLCLYAARGIDLRGPLRAGASARELREILESSWTARADRGAEERLALRERTPLVPLTDLRGDPHLEMHTRGG